MLWHIAEVDRRRLYLKMAFPSLFAFATGFLGYTKAAALVKRALAERRPLFDVAREEKIMPDKDLRRVLDPLPMTKGGVQD